MRLLWHFCPSWERDPSHVALSEVSMSVRPPLFLLLLRVKDRGCHTLLTPMSQICDLGIWAIQIKCHWFIILCVEAQLLEANKENEYSIKDENKAVSILQKAVPPSSAQTVVLHQGFW